MNNDEWKKVYVALSNTLDEFLLNYPNYRKGKNKQIRDTAERQVNSAVTRARGYIESNPEVLEMVQGGAKSSVMSRAPRIV